MQKSDLQTETSSFVDRYPQFVEAIVKQKEDLFWTEKEIDLNKDKHDLRKKLSPAQRHAVSFNQRLFTKYESVIGVDYWASNSDADSRKNPTDILVLFTKGPANGFLGLSAKATLS